VGSMVTLGSIGASITGVAGAGEPPILKPPVVGAWDAMVVLFLEPLGLDTILTSLNLVLVCSPTLVYHTHESLSNGHLYRCTYAQPAAPPHTPPYGGVIRVYGATVPDSYVFLCSLTIKGGMINLSPHRFIISICSNVHMYIWMQMYIWGYIHYYICIYL